MIGSIVYEMININEHDTRRINHALKVYGLTKSIAEGENVSMDELQTIEIAAVLHDIGISCCEKTFGKCSGKMQEKYGPGIAAKILDKYDLSENIKTRVLYLIANHHTYNNIKGIDHRILIEADFLVNYDEGNISEHAFASAFKRYFITSTGRQIAKKMFLLS